MAETLTPSPLICQYPGRGGGAVHWTNIARLLPVRAGKGEQGLRHDFQHGALP